MKGQDVARSEAPGPDASARSAPIVSAAVSGRHVATAALALAALGMAIASPRHVIGGVIAWGVVSGGLIAHRGGWRRPDDMLVLDGRRDWVAELARAMELCHVANPPVVLPRGAGLDVTDSGSSVTIGVRVDREPTGDYEGRVVLRTLDDLHGLHAQLKMALGGTVSGVWVIRGLGNYAKIVISYGAIARRAELIDCGVRDYADRVVPTSVDVHDAQLGEDYGWNASVQGWVEATYADHPRYVHPVQPGDPLPPPSIEDAQPPLTSDELENPISI